ncbi:MAG: biotin--[Eggerthellaceae bacterium]|nr:biotin--[acetyl-CoA-carboxylase] ligase [Eggerthellaceae bacterium]
MSKAAVANAACAVAGGVKVFRIERFESVASTNEGIKRALEQGEPEGLVWRAVEQTGGYGRQGRAWSSPAGGSYQSLLLRPQVPVTQLPTLGLIAALSVRAAIARFVDDDISTVMVKWPNDVVCAAGKLSGISCETHAGGVCVGIGVNVLRPEECVPVGGKYMPAYLCDLAGGTGSLEAACADRSALDVLADCEYGGGTETADDGRAGFSVFDAGDSRALRDVVEAVGNAVLSEFAIRYEIWQCEGFAAFLEEYRSCGSLTGRDVRIEAIDGSLLSSGRVVGVDEDGRLLLDTAGGIVPVSSGETHIA